MNRYISIADRIWAFSLFSFFGFISPVCSLKFGYFLCCFPVFHHHHNFSLSLCFSILPCSLTSVPCCHLAICSQFPHQPQSIDYVNTGFNGQFCIFFKRPILLFECLQYICNAISIKLQKNPRQHWFNPHMQKIMWCYNKLGNKHGCYVLACKSEQIKKCISGMLFLFLV